MPKKMAAGVECCNDHLEIGDDYGDNRATMRCRLRQGHAGPHKESYLGVHGVEVTVVWTPRVKGEAS